MAGLTKRDIYEVIIETVPGIITRIVPELLKIELDPIKTDIRDIKGTLNRHEERFDSLDRSNLLIVHRLDSLSSDVATLLDDPGKNEYDNRVHHRQ
jgi:phage terminase Nu1 subunit (DNA packaging protein)